MPQGKAPQRTVLIVIEEPTVRELMASNLRQAGLFAMAVGSVHEGHRLASEVRPDVVLLDLDAAGADSHELMAGLAQSGPSHQVTMVMTSSRTHSACGVHGENCGANLCVQKPFSPNDLLEQILRHLRARPARAATLSENTLRYGVLELDTDYMTATVQGPDGTQAVVLGVTEVKLLEYLMRNAHRANRREDILAEVWGNDTSIDIRTIDQHIRRLRRNLERIGAASLIRTVHRFGYRIDEALSSAPISGR